MVNKEMEVFTRPALGMTAELGDLYSCPSHSFTGRNIFLHQLPRHLRRVYPGHDTRTTLLEGYKISDKLKHLDVNDDMSLLVLCGNVKLRGSGKYLKTAKRHARDVSCALQHEVTIVREEVEICDKTLTTLIDVNAIEADTKENEATHFVAGIKWGSNFFLTATYKNVDNEEKRPILKNMDRIIRGVADILQGKAFEIDVCKTAEYSTFQFTGDWLSTKPLALTEVFHHVYTRSQTLMAGNEIGKQISYVLVPLDQLGLKIKMNIATKFSTSLIQRAIKIFDEIEDAKHFLNEFQDDPSNQFCRLSINTIQGFTNSENQLRRRITLLSKYRNSEGKKARNQLLKDVIEHFEQNHYFSSLFVICDLENNFPKSRSEEKMKSFRLLLQYNVILFSMQENLAAPDFIYKFYEHHYKHKGTTYIFFEGGKYTEMTHSHWRTNFQTFLSLIKTNESKSNVKYPARFVYVEGETRAVPFLFPTGIWHYENGKCVSKDVHTNNRSILSSRFQNKVLSIFNF